MKVKIKYLKKVLDSLNLSIEEQNNIIMSILTKREYKIFTMRLDSNLSVIRTCEEIGKQLHLTRQRISELFNKSCQEIINYCLAKNENTPKECQKPKSDQLIDFIKQLHHLPDFKECEFEDDDIDPKDYYDRLKFKATIIQGKIDNAEQITSEEKQNYIDFLRIQKLLDEELKYREKHMVISSHAQEFINTINKLKRLPKQTRKGQQPERTFANGADQRSYWNALNCQINIIKKKNTPLTELEKQKLFDYEEICKVLRKYHKIRKKTLTIKEKKDILIDYMKKNHCMPNKQALFSDGTYNIFSI